MNKKNIFFILIFIFISPVKPNADVKFTDVVSPFCKGENKFFFLNNDDNFPKKIIIDVKRKRAWNKHLLYLVSHHINKVNSTKKKETAFQPLSSNYQLKKYFLANITVIYNKNITCKFKGKMRVHGGSLQDHFELNTVENLKKNKFKVNFPSLRIKLFDGHINLSRDFTILMPISRNGENEIFTTVLLRELGIITPETFFIDAEMNGISRKMIFQDRDELNILSFNKRRPGPILAENKRREFPEISLTRFRNFKEILSQKDIKLKHFLISIDKYNYLKLNHFSKQSIKKILKKEEIEKLSIFYNLMHATENQHGLDIGDKRLYYNIYLNRFEPVYYDGGSKILSKVKENNPNQSSTGIYETPYIIDVMKIAVKQVINKVNKVDLLSIKNQLSERGVQVERDVLQKTVNLIKKNILNNINLNFKNIKYKKNDNFNFYKNIHKYNKHFKLLFYKKDNFFEACDVGLKLCNVIKLEKKEIEEVFSNQIAKLGSSKYRLIRVSKSDYINNLYREKIKQDFYQSGNIKIYYNETKIKYNKETKTLNLKKLNSNAKVTIFNSLLENIKIISNVCLEIHDTLLRNIEIISEGEINHCKNDVHISSSNGHIKSIKKKNRSKQDAVDFDLSNISVDQIKIEGAGNDCLGVKNGNYQFNLVILNNCSDKSFSVGDDSLAKVEKIFIKNNNKKNDMKSEIVVKNSSKANIKETLIDAKNNICVAAYRKNNHFSGSKVILYKKKYVCNGKGNYEHPDSQIIFN